MRTCQWFLRILLACLLNWAGTAPGGASPVKAEASEAGDGACTGLMWDSCHSGQLAKHYRGGCQRMDCQYKLFEVGVGFLGSIVGHETEIRIGPYVQDAWRFDDEGCQGPLYISYSNESADPTCPGMLGANPQRVTSYTYDPATTYATMRLSVTYEPFSPMRESLYTLWQVTFDHTYSTCDATWPGVDCGGACNPLWFKLMGTRISRADGSVILPLICPWANERLCYQVQGCDPIAAHPSTWGRLKALYR